MTIEQRQSKVRDIRAALAEGDRDGARHPLAELLADLEQHADLHPVFGKGAQYGALSAAMQLINTGDFARASDCFAAAAAMYDESP